MIVVNESLLDTFRGPGKCEWCLRQCRRLEPHHWKPRGHGGGSRLDIPENLIAMGPAFECGCHNAAENGHIARQDVLTRIAARLGKTPEECQQRIWDLLRAKDGHEITT